MTKVRLGDVANEYKSTFKGSKKDLPVVGLEHLIPEDVVLRNWDVNTDNTFTKAFEKGTTLFGRRRAYLKKAVFAHIDGVCSGDITVIKAIKGKINNRLLPFVIQNDHLFEYAVKKSAGSLSPRVKWIHLKDYTFKLPDSDKQNKLADALWSITETIEKYEHLKECSKKLLSAYIDKKLEIMQSVKYLQFGKLVSYKEKSSIKAGEGKETGEFPFFTCSSEQTKWVDDYLYDDECIIIGTGGTASINYYDGKFSASTDCFIVTSNGKVSTRFLYMYLLSKIDVVQFGFRGVGLQHLSRTYLNAINVPLLSESDQEELLKTLSSINSTIIEMDNLIETYKKLRKKIIYDELVLKEE